MGRNERCINFKQHLVLSLVICVPAGVGFFVCEVSAERHIRTLQELPTGQELTVSELLEQKHALRAQIIFVAIGTAFVQLLAVLLLARHTTLLRGDTNRWTESGTGPRN